jgi:hypothetical protein
MMIKKKMYIIAKFTTVFIVKKILVQQQDIQHP